MQMTMVVKGLFHSIISQKKVNSNKHPIDFVVTWVDGNDPEWRAECLAARKKYNGYSTGNEAGRYRDWDSFRFWFRAVEKYAPWVRYVHLVTWGHTPSWLNTLSPKLRIVRHCDFIPQEYLPTFNSNTIELNLFRIPGLSENFVYFNDDVLLCRPVEPAEFFLNGKPRHSSIAVSYVNRDNELPYHLFFNTYGVINRMNNIKECMEKHPEKWFSYLYRRSVLSNIELWKSEAISGIYFTHMGVPFCRSTMEKTWEKHEKTCVETSSYRFRDIHQITHQLFSIEDMLNGHFEPSRCDWGTCLKINDYGKIAEAYESGATKMICLFDGGNYTEEEIETINEGLVKTFTRFLPDKSSFEI